LGVGAIVIERGVLWRREVLCDARQVCRDQLS
jgi:hypothetical protein